MKKKIFLEVALFGLVVALLIFSIKKMGGPFWVWAFSKTHTQPITYIAQTGPEKEALKTAYLTQLLNLNVDEEIPSCNFNSKKAQKLLLASPVIFDAKVKCEQDKVYIDYTTPFPKALLGDFENIAIDKQQIPFPMSPFFSPKKIPKVYLGLDPNTKLVWNKPIEGEKIQLAFDLLDLVTGPAVSSLFNVTCIDVSSALKRNYGQREIVLATSEEITSRNNVGKVHCFLRLSKKNYRQELANYLRLRPKILAEETRQLGSIHPSALPYAKTKVIDLRVCQLAFVEDQKSAP